MTDLERIALDVIAGHAAEAFQERADREWWRDWSDGDAYRRFVGTLMDELGETSDMSEDNWAERDALVRAYCEAYAVAAGVGFDTAC